MVDPTPPKLSVNEGYLSQRQKKKLQGGRKTSPEIRKIKGRTTLTCSPEYFRTAIRESFPSSTKGKSERACSSVGEERKISGKEDSRGGKTREMGYEEASEPNKTKKTKNNGGGKFLSFRERRE